MGKDLEKLGSIKAWSTKVAWGITQPLLKISQSITTQYLINLSIWQIRQVNSPKREAIKAQ